MFGAVAHFFRASCLTQQKHLASCVCCMCCMFRSQMLRVLHALDHFYYFSCTAPDTRYIIQLHE